MFRGGLDWMCFRLEGGSPLCVGVCMKGGAVFPSNLRDIFIHFYEYYNPKQ